MDIERPLRIRIPSHKEPEKSKEIASETAKEKPIDEQFRTDFREMERTVSAYREKFNNNPAHTERLCQSFEKEWTDKLEKANLKHSIDPMKSALDAVRNDDKPDLTFTMEMRPALKLKIEPTRRQAEFRGKESERDI